MGIITHCFACEVCNGSFRIRYNLGNSFPQLAVFNCSDCGETLSFGYDADQNTKIDKIVSIEYSPSIKVINLHPELPIKDESKHDPMYFPSLAFQQQYDARNESEIDFFVNAQASCIDYQQFWLKIKTDFRYLKEGRWQFLQNEYGLDRKRAEMEILLRVFYSADFFLQGKWALIADDVLKKVIALSTHPGFVELRTFLEKYKEEFLFNKMYTVMVKYGKVESALQTTLLNQKCSVKPEGVSSFVDWQSLEKVYGDFYEIYGDLMIVPTVLNNLQVRGSHDRFDSIDFTLDKYLSSDKAGRAKNFMNDDSFSPLAEHYDSAIRNGTHHEASVFDESTQLITLRIGKGGKNKKVMSLVDYIVVCNEIYARILITLRSYYMIKLLSIPR